jgi:hypothetical protein
MSEGKSIMEVSPRPIHADSAFRCPRCGRRLYVVKGPKVVDGKRIRRVRCPVKKSGCGFIGKTAERASWMETHDSFLESIKSEIRSTGVLNEVLALPDIPLIENCVYFLCKKSEVIYIGMTSNLFARATSHLASPMDFDTIHYFVINSKLRDKLEAFEAKMMLHFSPPCNAQTSGKHRGPMTFIRNLAASLTVEDFTEASQ